MTYAKNLARKIITEAEAPSGQLSPEFEKMFKTALDDVWKELPSQLKTFAATKGDKDNEVDLITINQEAVGMVAAGMALSAPAMIQMMGKASKWVGKKLNKDSLEVVGDKLAKFGEKWHHAYEESVYKVLKRMVPANTSDELVRQAAHYLFMTVVGSLGIAAGTGAMELAGQGQSGMAGIEGLLSAIKAKEVSPLVKGALGRIFATMAS